MLTRPKPEWPVVGYDPPMPTRRRRIEALIERLIEALDQHDGDPDLEFDDSGLADLDALREYLDE